MDMAQGYCGAAGHDEADAIGDLLAFVSPIDIHFSDHNHIFGTGGIIVHTRG